MPPYVACPRAVRSAHGAVRSADCSASPRFRRLHPRQQVPDGRELLTIDGVSHAGKNAFIEIHDNGSGIEESLLPQIFTPNFTTKSSGTGLGLAFVKQALENMGGNISYRTELGQGTTFYINIPLES